LQQPQPCSPRSMYSLATALGIRDVKEDALKDIQSKLSVSNILQELNSSFSVSHEAVMKMEIDFLHKNITGKHPKLLTDYIQSMASGESPFFPAALSLIFDGLVGRIFPKQYSFTFGPGNFPRGRSVTTPTLSQPSSRASASASPFNFNANSPITPTVAGPSTFTPAPTFVSRPPVPSPTAAPSSTPIKQKALKCIRCSEHARLGQLYGGLHCPRCPDTGKNGTGVKGRPYMCCSGCNQFRTKPVDYCSRAKCNAKFL